MQHGANVRTYSHSAKLRIGSHSGGARAVRGVHPEPSAARTAAAEPTGMYLRRVLHCLAAWSTHGQHVAYKHFEDLRAIYLVNASVLIMPAFSSFLMFYLRISIISTINCNPSTPRYSLLSSR